MSLAAAFRAHLAALDIDLRSALIAVSGGPDSVALLDLLATCDDLQGADLVIAHADHGIRPESGTVAKRVEDLAAAYHLPCEVGQLALGPGASETEARLRRYAWLDAVRRQRGVRFIVTGHHADDQSETVLMRVLRGSGPAGLAGMTSRRGTLVRPLLPFRRAELARYLRERRLSAWDDPANHDPVHLRSWLRADLLPRLRARLPDIDRALVGVGRQAASDRAAWDAVLDVLPGLDFRGETDGISVATEPFKGYDSSLALTLLRAASRRAGFTLGTVHAAQILALARCGASGSVISLGQWQAEVAFGRLRLVVASSADADSIRALMTDASPLGADAREPVAFPGSTASACEIVGELGETTWGRWRLVWDRDLAPPLQARDGMTAWFIPDQMEVRAWRPGDRIRPLAGRGGRPVVRCFQEARVPRTRRLTWPVMVTARGVVWVPGVCRSDDLLPGQGTEALRVAVAHL